ncbi:MAG: pirin family protein [Hydrogenophaga sp.]|jgi:redox-sensitive bicupin YhaK (pirin superfamily)|uniref:pirin family protein n=1 Tax=Hydrogenophaga sp. TaxID=1904254 RepID=UPI001D52E420|nr:pirin family protein [Hydrogenophaga sp.]MBW0171103.1 pirin family protein [Hydrogenophaga sp.]MBW0184536.1 pirin family protein [Hydrogenophaga sp.]
MLEMVITAREADLGHGLKVRRVLPYAKRRMVGPWIFVDHAGPVTLAAEDTRAADVRPHPHIGLSTVSYLLSGQVSHRDSLGVHQLINPGDVNWMTAGRGISHSERFKHPDSFAGGGLELMQLWVALPEADEETDPAFTHYPSADLPVRDEGGVWMRLIAGEAYGMKSPVRTHSPLFYLHTEWQPGARLALPGGYSEQAAYVARGEVEYDGVTYVPGQLLVFGNDTDATLKAHTKATLMVFGGEPVGERHVFWNFVSSRKERIEQAKADWAAGRFALPPDDNQEWIPLP